MSEIHEHLKDLVEKGKSLTAEEARSILIEILDGEAADVEIAALLTAMSTRRATANELTGVVQAMRSLCRPIPLTPEEQQVLVDTCGTGGDGCGTFNISTAAALVAAAAGVRIAKHGNRGVTSKCGSADVLEALGIPVDLEPDEAAECLRQTGFMFLHAPRMHPAMKRVQPVRRALGFRTIFNLAGPLTNPAGAGAQVIGVFERDRVPVVSEAMARLGARHAFVVHGADGLDELSLDGPSDIAEVRDHSVRLFHLTAADAGLPSAPATALAGGDAARNAEILKEVLEGRPGAHRDVVLLNAAAALIVSGLATDFPVGVRLAAKAIDSGAGKDLLLRLQQFRQSSLARSSK